MKWRGLGLPMVALLLALFSGIGGVGNNITWLSTATGLAQSASPQANGPPCPAVSLADRSSQPIPLSQTNATLPGHVVPDVRKRLIPVISGMPDSFVLHMELVFKIRNLDQFQKCLDSINDPSSPNYDHFLNATTLQPFLPTPGQKSSVVSFLTRNGFNITDGPSPLVVKMSASVGKMRNLFGAAVNLYRRSGNYSFYSPDSDPKLPQNLVALINGIVGLENYTTVRPSEHPCSGPYCPQGIQVGYSLSPLYTSGYDGSGQKVAIVDLPGDPDMQGAINTYTSQYGLASTTLNIVCVDGCPTSYDSGWETETALDVEAVHTVAPGAGIVLLYENNNGDPMDAIDYVATNHLASIVSNSWTYSCGGECSDTQLTPALVSSHDLRLATDASQGLTILFASGDSGARPDGTNLGTEFPSSDPNVLAVGATNLVLNGCGQDTCTGYGSETGASISGGGYSQYFTEPSWQTSAIGSKSGRAVPDVSMLGYNPYFWVYSSRFGWRGVAGTSLSTPLWAGFLSIVLQIRAGSSSMGNLGPTIYPLLNSPSYSLDFHDVTTGSNNGYSAAAGWDPVTGLGTPIANHLASDLALPRVTVTSNPIGSGYVAVDGNPITTPTTYAWPLNSVHTLAANSPVGCGQGCQYVFVSWSDSGAQTHTITASTSATYTATFKQQYMLTTSVNPTGAGTVSVASGWQDAGTSVPVTETPNIGYSFYYWNLDATNVGMNPTYTVSMNSAHTLTAIFRGSSSISLLISTGTITLGQSLTLSGTITPTPSSPGITAATPLALSYSTDGGGTWSLFITTQTNNGGAYSIIWYPPYSGSYLLRSTWNGDQNYAGSASPSASLGVTGSRPPQITMLVSGSSSVSRGSSATFDVLVINPGSATTTTLYIEIMGPSGYYYFDTLPIALAGNSNGRFQFTWQAPTAATGTYQISVGLIPPGSSSITQGQVTVT